MPLLYKKIPEAAEAVQFLKINKTHNLPVFNALPEWIHYAFENHLLYIDGDDLLWGFKELGKRIKPGNWIVRYLDSGRITIKSDTDFNNQYELLDQVPKLDEQKHE